MKTLSQDLQPVRLALTAMLVVLLGHPVMSQRPAAEPERACEEHTITLSWYQTPANVEGAAFSIDATFDANVTAAQEAVIQQAIAEWEAVIKDAGVLPNPYPIDFANGSLSGSTIGSHTKVVEASGLPVSSSITIDDDGTVCWFIDPSPGADTEFADGSVPCSVSPGNCSTDGTTACTGSSTDLLSVVRHEIGHAMGWTSTSVLTSHITGFMFDEGRWSIAMDPGGTAHADASVFPNDLMVPAIGSNTRRGIELYPDAVVGALHYTRDIVMGFADVDEDGVLQIGMADFPWHSLANALDYGVPGEVLLLAPGTYDEVDASNLVMSSEQTLLATNGGSAVIE